MTTYVEYEPPSAAIAAFNANIDRYPTLLTTAYKRATSRLLSRWLAALRVEPPSAQNFYPIHWKTAKQRRAFFATDGFGQGIPTQRTHELVNAWKGRVDSFENGGDLVVENRSPIAQFPYGTLDTPRQPMFEASLGGIPWLDPLETSAPFMDEAEIVLLSTLDTVLSPTAGVTP